MSVQTKTKLCETAGALSAILSDFSVRVAPKSTIRSGTAKRLIQPQFGVLSPKVVLRILRLNCVTDAYADLWEQVWQELAPAGNPDDHPFNKEAWTGGIDYPGRPSLGDVGPKWTPDTPLRRDSDRRQAVLEIDVLVAMALGVTVEELATIYRTQFPVLYGYDQNDYLYDANGRVVPTPVRRAWNRKKENITAEECTHTHPGSGVEYVYQPPFRHLDRESDFKAAFEAFPILENGAI